MQSRPNAPTYPTGRPLLVRPKLLFIAPVLALVLLIGVLTFHHKDPAELPVSTTTIAATGIPVAAHDMRAVTDAVTAVNTWNTAAWYAAAQAADETAWYEAATAARTVRAVRAPQVSHPSPSSQPVPEPAVGSGDAESAIRKYFGDIFDQAWRVTECESGHNPGAISRGGGNYGLFQINYTHAADFEAYTGHPYHDGALDADLNAMYARKLYDASGWGPWSCRWAA